ncbi:MAG TPA: type II toxin-antitoxin system HicA family toxin [Candidatus Fraserbacteria bacterium]|nr:type II toxin-antitoxin system HicA family toxin [Candidatus Fraserbacteria bacterium]
MTHLPQVTGWEVIMALKNAGFEVVRVRGSHHRLKHADGRMTTIPVHAGETIGPGLMASILRDVELTRAEFLLLL